MLLQVRSARAGETGVMENRLKADFHSDACMLVKLRFNFEGKTVIHHFGTSARKLVLKRLTFELSVVRFVHVFGSVVSGFQ